MDFSKTKNIVASSAAALVGERFISPHTKTSQQRFSRRRTISAKILMT
jgi:hypothetical protein